MATKAIHKLGDISSDTPDICQISQETETHYIGSWVFGFGFFGVEFPKETTRELNEEDIQKYNGLGMALGDMYLGELKLK